MNLEEVRLYALSKNGSTEDMPFDDQTVTIRIRNKMFLVILLDKPEWIVMKCDPERAIALREAYPNKVLPAWHFNKKYWNMVAYSNIDGKIIKEWINHSYEEVVKKLPKKEREELKESI